MVLGPNRGHDLRTAGLGAEQRVHGVPRCQLRQREDTEGQDEQHDDQAREPAGDEEQEWRDGHCRIDEPL